MANYREDIVNIELSSGTVARSELNHTLGGGDYAADRFGVRAYRNSSPENLTGTISGYFIRADGYTVPIASGVVSGNKAYITLPAACYEVEGKFTLSIKLTGNGVNGTVRIVDGVVVRTSTSAAASTTLIPSVEQLIEQIEAVEETIPADYSDLWESLAANFSTDTAYQKDEYCTYDGVLYRFITAHSGAWSADDVVAVNLGAEISDLQKVKKPIDDLDYAFGEDKDGVITLVGEVVPYRYQQGSKITTQSSLRFRLPKNVKTVDIAMTGHYHINSYTLLDENDTVLSYKYERETAEVSYTDVNAWEATYLVCGNNNQERDTIVVKAHVGGMGRYIDEAKKAGGEQYTLLSGAPKATFYKLLEENEGNYSVEYDVEGYDFVEITSVNATTCNKYTMFNDDDEVVNFFYNDVEADWEAETTVKICVPSNAVKMWVGTYRVSRPDVLVYGIKMPADYGWEPCGGEFVNYYCHGPYVDERTNGSKEFAASPFDILRMTNGISGNGVNIFSALDSNNDVLAYVSFAEGQNEAFFICPKGTVKVAISGGLIGRGGWNTPATLSAEKRKTSGKLSIMGDSISTYLNFMPSGQATYYELGNRGVPSASYLWWGVVAREMGWGLSTINAWSGSEVATPRSETSAMCMARTANLAENGTPDVIIILGGVNDFLQEVPIGTWAGKAAIPTTGENFRKAYAMMLNKIHTNYPNAKVYCCTLLNCNRDNVPGNLENIGGQYLHEFNDAIRQIAPIMNCHVIDLDTCGINQYNLETYMGDYNSSTEAGLHPNAAGHRLMADRMLKQLI